MYWYIITWTKSTFGSKTTEQKQTEEEFAKQ